jgi:rubredoxin
MAISFTCPKCGKRSSFKDEAGGKDFVCPDCGASCSIPGPPSEKAILDRLDRIGGIALAIHGRLGWIVLLLFLLLVSSCGREITVIRGR